jgi:hypothetical protein
VHRRGAGVGGYFRKAIARKAFFFEKKVTAQIGSNVQRRAWQAAESGSFLKKRTKKLCEFGFGLSWKTEAE